MGLHFVLEPRQRTESGHCLSQEVYMGTDLCPTCEAIKVTGTFGTSSLASVSTPEASSVESTSNKPQRNADGCSIQPAASGTRKGDVTRGR